jgi:excisionase family DNA binding protein
MATVAHLSSGPVDRRPFFTPKTLAAYLAISPRTVRDLLSRAEIESVKVAGVRRIPPDAVDEYLKARTTKAKR